MLACEGDAFDSRCSAGGRGCETPSSLHARRRAGHGDLGLAVLRLRRGGITFIDFELAGQIIEDTTSSTLSTSKSPAARTLLYCPSWAYLGEGATQRAADACLLETKLFEPLTWLEAAIFFSLAPYLPERGKDGPPAGTVRT